MRSDQLHGGLPTDSGNARYVIRVVARESQHIGNSRGRDTPFFRNFGGPEESKSTLFDVSFIR